MILKSPESRIENQESRIALYAFSDRYPPPYPRRQVDAADHEGDEDDRRLAPAQIAGARRRRAAVRAADARGAERTRIARRSVGAPAPADPRRRAGALAAHHHHRGPRVMRQLQ